MIFFQDLGSRILTTSQIQYIFMILLLNMAKHRYDLFLQENLSLFFPTLILGSGSGILDKRQTDPDPGYQKFLSE
jgi:hypothetical protein